MAITANLWALLGITLVVGFFFGLFVSNAGKYKRQWRAERRERERVERERDTLVSEHERLLQARDARIVALEGSAVTPRGADGVVGRDSDSLSAIAGIDAGDEARLNQAGYFRYAQIADLSAEEERMLETALNRDPGTIERMQWRDQARMLADGRVADHVRDFPAKGRIL
ncbi:hypothetical protein BH10PSE12_BH10PSE12_11660 [soil metagenome]